MIIKAILMCSVLVASVNGIFWQESVTFHAVNCLPAEPPCINGMLAKLVNCIKELIEETHSYVVIDNNSVEEEIHSKTKQGRITKEFIFLRAAGHVKVELPDSL